MGQLNKQHYLSLSLTQKMFSTNNKVVGTMKHAVTRPWFVHLIVLFILLVFFIYINYLQPNNEPVSGADLQADTTFLTKQLEVS